MVIVREEVQNVMNTRILLSLWFYLEAGGKYGSDQNTGEDRYGVDGEDRWRLGQ